MENSFKLLKNKDKGHFKITIFGSSRVKKNDIIYKQTKKLAFLLGEKDMDVITGGGPGLMQAANEGHRLGTKKVGKKAHSIGIGVKLLWKQKFNKAVQFKREFNKFSQRLDEFMLLSNAVVVTPGGLGTLLELFYSWQLVQVYGICNMPIILMGETWGGLLKWIKKDPLAKKYLDKRDYNLIFHVKNPKQALSIIEEKYKDFQRGGKNFCLNYKKYKIK